MTNKMKKKTIKKVELEKFFDKHKNILLGISLFLLVTTGLVDVKSNFNYILAILSASITYVLFFGMDFEIRSADSFLLTLFKILLRLFVSAFAAWVLINIVFNLESKLAKLIGLVVWLILILLPNIKEDLFKKKA